MIEHTPTPWVADIDQRDGALCIQSVKDGEVLYYIARMIGGYRLSDEDAAFIVRACNVHDELVAALQKIAGMTGGAVGEVAAGALLKLEAAP